MPKDIKSMYEDELKEELALIGEPSYRASQIYQWLHKGVKTFDEMTNISKKTSSHLTAKVNVANTAEYIVFSIPYEEDWKVRLDGKKVKPVRIMDSLLAVKVSPGEHDIDLSYIPYGLIIGAPISIGSLRPVPGRT